MTDTVVSAPRPLAALTVFSQLASSPKGLTEAEAAARLARHGENLPDVPVRPSRARALIDAVRSPFVALLAGLGAVFAGLGDARGAVTVAFMLTLSVVVRLWQRGRSER